MDGANLPALKGSPVLTAEALADMVELTRDAIHKDVHLGCPVIFRGSSNQTPTTISLAAWVRWKVERARRDKRFTADGNRVVGDPKDRALEATAAKREAEVAKMRGELVPLAALTPIIEDGLINLRTKIDSLEERLTGEYGKELAREIQDFVLKVINDVVEDIVEEAENLEV